MSKTLEMIAVVLLVVGGLNWGLVGIFDFNLVTAIFGHGSFLSRLVFILVGLAGVYQAIMLKHLWQHWSVQMPGPAHA